MAALDSLLIDHPKPGVTRLTLNRPTVLNALTIDLVNALNDALEEAGRDEACRVLIITGAGKGFCSGQDMQVAASRSRAAPRSIAQRMAGQNAFAGMVTRMRRIPQPVIAAVKGAAAGAGMALALGADVRIAGKSARFLVAAVRIGLSAGETGISYHLPRLIGAGRAFPILLTGRPIAAEEAERIGLVASVVDDEALEQAALDQADAIIANSPFAVAQTKRMMWANLEASSLDEALELENRTQILATLTEDYKEATLAFAEKRPPKFTGN